MTEEDWKQTGSKDPLGTRLSHRHRATVEVWKTPSVSLMSSGHGIESDGRVGTSLLQQLYPETDKLKQIEVTNDAVMIALQRKPNYQHK